MDQGKHKSEHKPEHGHGPGRRERRSKPRLSDVHRLVDAVLPKHMPDKAEKPKHEHDDGGDRRSGGHHKK